MSQTPSWLLAISILSTALVSIAGVLVPIWLEINRSRREDKRIEEALKLSEIAEIDTATQDLLRVLSFFRSPTMREVDAAITKSGIAVNTAQAMSVLQSSLYTWESKVWQELSATDRQRVKDIRLEIETKHAPYVYGPHIENPFAPVISDLVERILSIARRAAARE